MTNISTASPAILPLNVKKPSPSPFELCFLNLLSALDQHIKCERDLDDVELFDPAYRTWLDDAEEAQLRLYEALASATGLSAHCSGDVHLRRMSLLIAMLVREGTAEVFRRYERLESSFACYMAVPGTDRDSAGARQMLATAHEMIQAMVGLTLYRQDGNREDDTDELLAVA